MKRRRPFSRSNYYKAALSGQLRQLVKMIRIKLYGKFPYKAGKHFLQIPGPSNVPDRILQAMDYPTIDHRGPDFAKIGAACLAGMKTIFKTDSHVVIIRLRYRSMGSSVGESAGRRGFGADGGNRPFRHALA